MMIRPNEVNSREGGCTMQGRAQIEDIRNRTAIRNCGCIKIPVETTTMRKRPTGEKSMFPNYTENVPQIMVAQCMKSGS